MRSISLDGKKIAFTSSRNGVGQIWVKDLVSGAERQFTTGTEKTQPHDQPGWKARRLDGKQLQHPRFLSLRSTAACQPRLRRLRRSHRLVAGWADFSLTVLSQITSVGLLEVATGNKTEYLEKSTAAYLPRMPFRRDGKWIVFTARRDTRDFTIYVAPFSASRRRQPSGWRLSIRPKRTPTRVGRPMGICFISAPNAMVIIACGRSGWITPPSIPEDRFSPCSISMSLAGHGRAIVPVCARAGRRQNHGEPEERAGGIWMLQLQD